MVYALTGEPFSGNMVQPTNLHTVDNSSLRTGVSPYVPFDFKAKGMMALIGQRNGVGILFGHRIHGFTAWWLWRSYYLGNLPTVEKKLRVSVDWFIDLFFKRDVTRLKTLTVKRSIEDRAI